MFRFRSCNSRWQEFWFFLYLVALLHPLMWCYDPCPENLRQSQTWKQSSISKDEIEKAFQEAEKIVNNQTTQEERLVREGRVLNVTIKSPESAHPQASVSPRVREMELRQRVFQEASSILIKKYKIPPDEVCCGLPSADLSSPSAARAVQKCANSGSLSCSNKFQYRHPDGRCNNLNNPTWGSAFSCFIRLLPAAFSDNGEFRRSVTGVPLPEPRQLSLMIHSHENRPSHELTHMHMFFGQFLDHDITLTSASTTDEGNAIRCCPVNNTNHHQCAPVIIPSNDPFYSTFNVTCLNFVRSAICDYCKTGPREQINQVTAFIDASHIYGNSDNETNTLRDMRIPGNLRVQRTTYGDLPPPSPNPRNETCSFPDENLICFLTGDGRANQHLGLISLHTMFIREHNCIASQMRTMNPQWSHEKIFQETRKIIGAEMQVITYKEYLPPTLGDRHVDSFSLRISHTLQSTLYDSRINPSLYTEFSTASFRFGHSMINSLLAEIPEREGHSGHLLRDIFIQPFGLYTGEMDPIMRGSIKSPSQNFDRHMVPDVTNFVYRRRGSNFGLDLAALNIQRGRDHGIPTYVDVVRHCSNGQVNIGNFDDLARWMHSENVDALRRNYRDVRDIDLFVGTLLENREPGAVVGPSTVCVLGLQFQRLKCGDRFYFEHGGVFTERQREELKKITLARLMCDHTGIEEIQRNAMVFPSFKNPVLPCSNLPKMDLNAWKESMKQ